MGGASVEPFLKNCMISLTQESEEYSAYGSHSRAEHQRTFNILKGGDFLGHCFFVGCVKVAGVDGIRLIDEFKGCGGVDVGVDPLFYLIIYGAGVDTPGGKSIH